MSMNHIDRVLLVDDDQIYLEIASAMLEAEGVSCIRTASTAQDGAMRLQEDAPDLLMLDLNMPGADGVEFIEFMREHRIKTPVLVVSSAHQSVTLSATILAEAYGCNIVGLIEKPLTQAKLRAFNLPFKGRSEAA